MTNKTGGPAFPRPHSEPPHYAQEGMTLRDYMAAKAMEALLIPFLQRDLDTLDPLDWMDGVAGDAYLMADAMLRARSKS